MFQFSRLVHLLVSTAIVLSTTLSTAEAAYTFTNIIDSTVPAPTGNYLNIGDAAVSGNKVAFKAGYNQGFLGIIDSIFTSSGGPRTKVVQELTDLRDFLAVGTIWAIGRPAIEGNKVYFDARIFYPATGFQAYHEVEGVFYGEGLQGQGVPLVSTAVSPSAIPPFATYKTIADPLISDGFLAYRIFDSISVSNPDRTSSARIVDSGDAAPQGGTFSAIDANYGLSAGTVAFRGFYGSQQGIFTGAAGAPLTTIAQKGDPTPLGGTFNTVLDPAISGGTVAFLGTYANGNGIFTGNGGPLSTIVTTDDVTPGGHSFTTFSTPAIGRNTVAFRADYSDGTGIYAKTFSSLSKVVEIGDPLFGSTVGSLNFSDLGLDPGGSGNLAFTYGLADGRTGVAMAVRGAGLPTIFQDRNGTVPVPDSVGIVFVPVANFEGRNLTKAYLSGADLRNANARNVNLTGAYLRSADLTDANLSGANLSGAVLAAARLTGANFNGAEVRGARFTREIVPVVEFHEDVTVTAVGYGGITPAQLAATASYQAHDLTGISLEGNNLTNANLVGQNLTGANFTFATLGGANLTGAEIRGASFARYSISVTIPMCDNFRNCKEATDIIGTGITLAQLQSTASYLAHDLTGINFGGNDLAGASLAGQNLSYANFAGSIDNSPAANLANANLSHAILQNANFGGATLTGADLTGADARGAGGLGGYGSSNLIRPDGHVAGLDLNAGQMLSIRDYDGNSSGTIPITVDEHFAMGPGGTLRAVLKADAWNSTISFAAGIPVALGGSLELLFATGTDAASQVGRTFKLFDWTGVAPTGVFNIVSPHTWNLSNLYTTGEVMLTAVPEPATFVLLIVAAAGWCQRRSRTA